MPRYLETIPNLNMLKPGQVSLGVPIRESNNAIQLSRFDRIPTGARLDVQIEPGLIAMQREDGDPVQIESYVGVNISQKGKKESYDKTPGILVFAEPLGRLTLCQQNTLTGWMFQEVELTDANSPHLTTFAKLIGTYVRQKQLIVPRNQIF